MIPSNIRTAADRPLSTNFMFPHYTSRQDYEAKTGKSCPPWDGTKPVKRWEDPAAAAKGRTRASCTYLVLAVNEETGLPLQDQDGKPYLETIALPAVEAGAVNIPTDHTTNDYAREPAWPDPLKPLGPNETLIFDHANMTRQTVLIRDLAQYAEIANQQAVAAGKFMPEDRALLQAIAAKLEVSL